MSVRSERHGAVLVVRINRAAKRNAIDAVITAGIDAALNDFEDDARLRVAIVTGEPGIFSAGTDLNERSGLSTKRGGEYGILRRRALKPLIAAVDGLAMGGGFEIALASDLVVASSDSDFSLPEPRRGVIASSGAMFRAFERLPHNVALELLVSGRTLSAERAHELGFVNVLAAPGDALRQAIALAREICASAPNSIHHTLRAIRSLSAAHDEAGWQATADALSGVIDSADMREGIAAFFDRRPPSWSAEGVPSTAEQERS